MSRGYRTPCPCHLVGLLTVLNATAFVPCEAAPTPTWASRVFAAELATTRAPEIETARRDQSPPEQGKKPCRCSDPATRARLSRCFPSLLVHDAGKVFSAPARWGKKDWGLFAAGVVGVGALTLVDDDVRTAVLRSHDGIQDTVARIFEPFGSWASFVTLGGFYLGGIAGHDEKAQGAARDGFIASIIAAGVITPVLKVISGRSRPNAGEGPYDFDPFHGGPSFPSGHATQAFAVASVIATEYPAPWVQAACYTPASLVMYARMRHDAHWASDVTAGALIGYAVGHTVARQNLPLRMGTKQARLIPLLRRGESGALLTAEF